MSLLLFAVNVFEWRRIQNKTWELYEQVTSHELNKGAWLYCEVLTSEQNKVKTKNKGSATKIRNNSTLFKVAILHDKQPLFHPNIVFIRHFICVETVEEWTFKYKTAFAEKGAKMAYDDLIQRVN